MPDAWFQLPAQVTINRFFHGLKDSNAKLLEKYGAVRRNGSDGKTSSHYQKYAMKVLFGSSKECSNDPSDAACYSVPQSPLPKDIYGDETDLHPEGKYNRPKYMSGTTVMGRVEDLRPIYKAASEMLEFDDIGKRGSQYIFSEIFGVQEYARALSSSSGNGLMSWLSSIFSSPKGSPVNPPNITLNEDNNYEFGIGLDYSSSIFQVMNNSVEDVRFVRFNHPSVIASPSRISAKAFKNPIRLPQDLALAPPPFYQNQNSSPKPNPPLTELDNMHEDTALWTDIELSTNVIVPGSSVPASLNFHGSEYLLDGDMWAKMWFHPNARALMRQYIRSPDGPLAASAAAEGGDKWWDLRGGKGGVWTDRGEWLDWNELCGAFDDKVFGDDKGQFMREKEEIGGSKAIYKFGKLVEGKEPAAEPANLNAHKALMGESFNKPAATGQTEIQEPIIKADSQASDKILPEEGGRLSVDKESSNSTSKQVQAALAMEKVLSSEPKKGVSDSEVPNKVKEVTGQQSKAVVEMGSWTQPTHTPQQDQEEARTKNESFGQYTKPGEDDYSDKINASVDPDQMSQDGRVMGSPNNAVGFEHNPFKDGDLPESGEAKIVEHLKQYGHGKQLTAQQEAEGGKVMVTPGVNIDMGDGEDRVGEPMSLGNGMEVSGTMDMDAVKQSSLGMDSGKQSLGDAFDTPGQEAATSGADGGSQSWGSTFDMSDKEGKMSGGAKFGDALPSDAEDRIEESLRVIAEKTNFDGTGGGSGGKLGMDKLADGVGNGGSGIDMGGIGIDNSGSGSGSGEQASLQAQGQDFERQPRLDDVVEKSKSKSKRGFGKRVRRDGAVGDVLV